MRNINTTIGYIILSERYLTGQMDTREATYFQEELKRNDMLKDDLMLLIDYYAKLKDDRALKDYHYSPRERRSIRYIVSKVIVNKDKYLKNKMFSWALGLSHLTMLVALGMLIFL
ncbi:hypothetical protein [Algivirga pacifica]|uniref:Uncharacterized protein n=1 Tax=Algivirga pacifica TaxID=1162670 RepID=A0ABP9DR24_9BACT